MSIAISRGNAWFQGAVDELNARYLRLKSAARIARIRRERYRTTIEELSALPDRDLLDIGISRSDIPHLAYEESIKVQDHETR